MEWLLPKKDQERLSLHRYLNAQESNAVLIKDIMADLGWSRYMVLQNVETLRFDVLMDIFFEVAQSNEMIAFRHSSSTTVARVTKVEVNDELAKYGIRISNNYQLVGDERNIRILLFEMLYTAYADQPSPFPDDIEALAAKVEHLVEEHTPMRATVKRAFRIFFGIWMVRIRNGHVIQPSEPDVFKPTEDLTANAKMIVGKLKEALQTAFMVNEPWCETELRFGLGSMYSPGLGFGTYRIDNLAPKAAETFDNIYHDIASVYEEFFGLAMTEAELATIRKSLFSLNLRLLYFRMRVAFRTQPRKQFSRARLPNSCRIYPACAGKNRTVL
ncbi:MAG: helix-turn-helix domain-containing protein [Weissella confusa]